MILTTKGLAKGITAIRKQSLVDGKSCLEDVFWKQELSQGALGELVSGWGATPSAFQSGTCNAPCRLSHTIQLPS